MGKKERRLALSDELSTAAANRITDFVKETGRIGVGIAYLALSKEMADLIKALRAKDVMTAAIMLGEDIDKSTKALDEVK